MKYGAHCYIFTDQWTDNSLAMLDQASRLGLDFFEISLGDDVHFDYAATRRHAEQLGLELTVSPGAEWPLPCDLSSEIAEERAAGLTWHKQQVDVAAELGATAYAGALYGHTGVVKKRRPHQDEIPWMAEGLHQLASYGEQAGVAIVIEPMSHFRTHLINTPVQALRLLESVDHAILSSPLQMKVPDLNLTISSTANLNVSDIALDTQSLDDLEQVLVTDLALVPGLGSLSLGEAFIVSEVESALTTAGLSADGPGILLIDEATRNEMQNNQEGMHFPDQVIQMVNEYINANPGTELSMSDDSSLPGTFGSSGQNVLRVQDHVELSSDLTGEGVLIIEGDFKVPVGVTFNWNGLVLVAPPAEHLSGSIDFSGTVNINGSLIISQEGIPNQGHMDVTTNTDPVGSWLSPWGINATQAHPWWEHTHNFSNAFGTQVGFTSTQPGFTVHESQTKFNVLLGSLSSNDELIFELVNHQNHGLATLSMGLTGTGMTTSRVAAGFDDLIKSPSDKYETIPIKVGDIEHLDIAISRLSSLKKMWDTDNPYPSCSGPNETEGPDCVGYLYGTRNESFILRVHQWDGFVKTHLYDASIYWHRRKEEEDDFNEEMADLLTDIQANNYGMDINLGPNTTITVDQAGMSVLGGFTGSALGGITNLGTWHRHWEADDPDNPLNPVTP